MPLSSFTPRVRQWFETAFAAPTPAQAQAWPAIARGEHVLLSAPTGSGKTLAAFLWALDRLSSDEDGGDGVSGGKVSGGAENGSPGDGPVGRGEPVEGHRTGSAVVVGGPRFTRVVYVSPLKALAYDIERNLRAPLRGIGANDVRVGIRTGDTTQRERAAMLRNPPDILITTPESLYLMLTSRARETLSEVEAVIVDEIHAVAHSKRGSHLALTLERLEAHVRANAPALNHAPAPNHASAPNGHAREIQRIGLSATQNPLEEIGRYLVGPHREVTIIDAGARKQLDLRIEVPVESMAEPGGAIGAGGLESDPLEPIPGGESTKGSIWPAIYPELLKLVSEHNSTIVFVNNRRSAERVALRLNELAAREDDAAHDDRATDERPVHPAPAEIARAHHGSLAREERTKVEELLKAGELPCLVATSSLELGIDMGAVDLVLQIESPKSVARGLQRIGRAGHGVGEVSRGRIFPKFRGDLLSAPLLLAACTKARSSRRSCRATRWTFWPSRSSRSPSPPSPPPPPPQMRHTVRPRTQASLSMTCTPSSPAPTPTPSSHASRSRTCSTCSMGASRLQEFGELRARIVWDRVAGTIRARKGSRQLAIANAGTIPPRPLRGDPPRWQARGKLDEEMLNEVLSGTGVPAGRLDLVDRGNRPRPRDRHPGAGGAPGAVPFWKGDLARLPEGAGRSDRRVLALGRQQEPQTLERDYDLDPRAARNLLDLPPRAAGGDACAAERGRRSWWSAFATRSATGGCASCLLMAAAFMRPGRSPSVRGSVSASIWRPTRISDDGIVLHLPDLDGDDVESLPSAAELVLIEPEEVEQALTAELGGWRCSARAFARTPAGPC